MGRDLESQTAGGHLHTHTPQKGLRPQNKSIWWGESKSEWPIFAWAIFRKLFRKKRSKIKFTKIDQANLDSPRRELSNGSLGIVVAFLVRRQNNFSRVATGGPIQLCNVRNVSVVNGFGGCRNLCCYWCHFKYKHWFILCNSTRFTYSQKKSCLKSD